MATPVHDAIEFLEARGYKIKSAAPTRINETYRTRTLYEQRSQPAPRPAPARPSTIYERASRLDWNALADRNQPLPQGMSVEEMLKAFEGFYVTTIADTFLR